MPLTQLASPDELFRVVGPPPDAANPDPALAAPRVDTLFAAGAGPAPLLDPGTGPADGTAATSPGADPFAPPWTNPDGPA